MRWQRHVENGRRYVSQGDYAQAEHSLLAAVKEALALGPADLRVASSLGILGKLKHRQGERDRAQALLERALAVREEALGCDHYGVVQGLNDLASLHYAYGQLDDARALFERALAIAEKQLAPDHGDIALALYNLSRVYFKSGDHLRAEPLLARLLELKERTLGPEHTDVAAILTALSRVRSMAGRHDEAEEMARRALAIREKALPDDDPAIAISLELVAYFCAGRAKRMRSLADAERILGGGNRVPHDGSTTSPAGDPALDSRLELLAAEERALRERARAIRSRAGERREPATLERSPEPVLVEQSSTSPATPQLVESAEPEEPAAHAAQRVDTDSGEQQESGIMAEPESRAPVTDFAPEPRVASPVRGSTLGQRGRWLIGLGALALIAAGGAGFAMGRGARPPATTPIALQESSRGAIEQPQEQPQAGSLQPPDRSDESRLSAAPPPPAVPDPVPARVRRPRPAARAPRLPSRLQTLRMTRTMERLGSKVMSGVELKVDSIGRSLELPPPQFDKP